MSAAAPADATPEPAPVDSGAPALRLRQTLGLALAVLLAHLALAGLLPEPGGFGKYSLAARQLLTGEMARERLIDFSPLYLELNRFALRLEPLFGPVEGFLPIFQLALVAWAAAAFAAAASRHLGRPAALVFALLFAFDRQMVVYARLLEPEMLLLALLASWLYFLDGALDGAPDGAASRRRLLLAGVAAALAIATRPTFLPVFLLAAPLFLGLRSGFRPVSRWLGRTACFLLPLLAMVVLLAFRAAAATGDYRSPAMNPGTVFFEGHQPLSSGTSARYPPVVHLAVRADQGAEPDLPHAVYRRIARAESGDPALPIAAVNDFWASRGYAFLADQPLLALRRAARQLQYSLHAYAFHDVPAAMLFDLRLPALFVPFSLLAAFALWGAAAAASEFRRLLLFYAILAAQLGVMTLFYVSARQRLVLLPAVVFFALLGWQQLRGLGRRGLGLGALLAALALALSLRDSFQHDDAYLREGFADALTRRAGVTAGLERGAPVAALRREVCAAAAEMPSRLADTRPADFPQDGESFEDCVAAALRERLPTARGSELPSREFDLAAVELLRGDLDRAEALLRPLAAAGAFFPREGADPATPGFHLARIAFLRGDAAAARRELETALAEHPGEPFLLADLLALSGGEAYRGQLLRYYSGLDLAFLHGRALDFYGRHPEAAAELAKVAEALPASRRARLELAMALAGAGRDLEALAQLRLAYQGRSEPVLQSARLLPLLERLAARAASARERAELGLLFFHHGAYRRAAELLGPAVGELGPAAPPELSAALATARTSF